MRQKQEAGIMRYMATYDLMETARVTNQWLGATARALGSYPGAGVVPNPFLQLLSAWAFSHQPYTS